MTDNEDLVLEVATLKVVSEVFIKRYADSRAELGATMKRGDRLTAWSPLDGAPKIGSVTLTDPKNTARIGHRAAFEAWVSDNYPGDIAYDFEILPNTDQEVITCLYDHAPHLLKKIVKINRDLEKQVCVDSAALGVPVGPSGEADVPGVVVSCTEPVVSCLPAKGAVAAVIDLFRSGRLTLEDFSPRELPGGAA
jgi:hypothetical protein